MRLYAIQFTTGNGKYYGSRGAPYLYRRRKDAKSDADWIEELRQEKCVKVVRLEVTIKEV